MKPIKPTRLLVIVMSMGLALACAGCGGGSKNSASSPTTAATQAPTDAPTAAPTTVPTEKPAETTPAPTAAPTQAPDPAQAGGGTGGYDAAQIKSQLTEGYMGITEAGEGAYFASNDDGSFVIVAFYDPATNNSVSFVGPGSSPQEGMAEVTDVESGLTLSFSLEAQADGTILIDMGDLGTAQIASCTVDEVVDALMKISAGSNPML